MVKMNFTRELSHDTEDLFGELLRDEFFDQKNGTVRGCYSTFVVRPDVVALPDENIDCGYDELNIHFHVFQKEIDGQLVVMKYYWDGDGTLQFHFADGSVLRNTDCKKDYTWDYISKSRYDYLMATE